MVVDNPNRQGFYAPGHRQGILSFHGKPHAQLSPRGIPLGWWYLTALGGPPLKCISTEQGLQAQFLAENIIS